MSLFLCFKISLAQKRSHSDKPNIIFILTDDQRFDAIGYAGNPYTNTPQMDALAKAGTYFHKAIVTTPICAASRASILTGLHERSHNYNFQTGNIRDEYMENSYPLLLRNNGYYTGFFGKYGVKYDHLDKQFDAFESYDRNNRFTDKRAYFYKTLGKDTVHLTRYTGQKALDFIDEVTNNQNKKPFCLSLSFSAPHAHDRAPDQYFWQNTTDPLLQDTIIPDPKLNDVKYFEAQPKMVRDGFNRLRWTWRYDTPEKYQHSLKGYYRMISGIDLEIKKIRQKLKQKGLDKNTVIIVMGDNGYFLGERQLAGKWLLYDNSIRVPLIVYDPRVRKHNDVEDMVLNIDVPYTIADLAGVKAPETWQGESLMPYVKGKGADVKRDTVLIEHLWDFNNIPPSEGVRTDTWKYFRYVNDKTIEELYNIKDDALEVHNLIGDKKYEDIAGNLRNKLDELSEKFGNKYRRAPFGLTVDLIREPGQGVKILDKKPKFGWIVPQESMFQVAYQILVASSEEVLSNNNGDIWDSGRVRSSLSTNVPYKGSVLEVGKSYFWKVRIWDEQNRLVDYSKPQKFTMGSTDGYIKSTENKFIVDTIAPALFEKRGDTYFMDFGKDAFATLNFTYRTKKPDSLIVRIGEMLEGDKINRTPPKRSSIRYQEMKIFVSPEKSHYQIDIKPDERNTLPKAVALPEEFPVLMPFRYAEIEGADGTITKADVTQLAFHTYWEEQSSSFQSDNSILNQVWDISKYSMKATTFAGLYIDGDRERIPYEADAYINQLGHYNTDREYAMARRTIEYFMKHPTWPTEWQQHVPMLVYEDYMYTGNTDLIKRYYEELKHKSLFELSDADGLISSQNVTPEFMIKLGFEADYTKPLTDIVDWPGPHFGGSKTKGERDGFVFQKYNTVINAFFYNDMKIMAEFARILGKTEDAMDFELRAAKVKKVLNDQMFDKERGVYVDGVGTDHASLHANMMPLAFGMVPEGRMDTVVKFIKSRDMACSVYGAQFLMDGLYNAREQNYALKLLTSTSDRSWYNMIRSGATITMEAWDNQYKINQDWNHAWGAAPANIIPRGLWGIKPKTPGFSVAIIDPQMGNLKSSSITVPTVRGSIKARYDFISQRNQTYTIEIPGNMIGEFKIDHISGKEIIHNGNTVPVLANSIILEPGKHVIQLEFNAF